MVLAEEKFIFTESPKKWKKKKKKRKNNNNIRLTGISVPRAKYLQENKKTHNIKGKLQYITHEAGYFPAIHKAKFSSSNSSSFPITSNVTQYKAAQVGRKGFTDGQNLFRACITEFSALLIRLAFKNTCFNIFSLPCTNLLLHSTCWLQRWDSTLSGCSCHECDPMPVSVSREMFLNILALMSVSKGQQSWSPLVSGYHVTDIEYRRVHKNLHEELLLCTGQATKYCPISLYASYKKIQLSFPYLG